MIPLIYPTALAALSALAFFRLERRARAASLTTHKCPECGYDLSSTPDLPCPECGATTPS